jgi:hypothetical protein
VAQGVGPEFSTAKKKKREREREGLLRRQRSGGSWFEASPGQIVLKTLFPKYPTQKRAGRVAQVVERLPSKREALSSNPKRKKNC